jgi:hypothetical protein
LHFVLFVLQFYIETFPKEFFIKTDFLLFME